MALARLQNIWSYLAGGLIYPFFSTYHSFVFYSPPSFPLTQKMKSILASVIAFGIAASTAFAQQALTINTP
jgi:hypothetical protein